MIADNKVVVRHLVRDERNMRNLAVGERDSGPEPQRPRSSDGLALNGGEGALSLKRKGGAGMIVRRDQVEIGNSDIIS